MIRGPHIEVELDGVAHAFRPLTIAEAHELVNAQTQRPEDALDLALDTCRACCVSDLAAFDRAVDLYPLAFSGEDGAAGELLRFAAGQVTKRTKDGISKWKASDRNPGRVARHLLAFKAYSGGDYDAETYAGALTLAEWMQATKGTFQLLQAFMKALARRKR